jgi:hypothetical protein
MNTPLSFNWSILLIVTPFSMMMSDCLYDSQEVRIYGFAKFAENPIRTGVPDCNAMEASGHCVRIIAPAVP